MKKVLLLILDGFGIAQQTQGNAVRNAHMPFYAPLLKQHPIEELHASGTHVGLLKGVIGNSEVGHLHIGAGRLVKQDLCRIFDAINNTTFFQNAALHRAMQQVKKTKSTLHVLGLLSDAGVHSHVEHLFALLQLAKKERVERVAIHAILDGRDVPPKSAEKYLRKTEQVLKKFKQPQWSIATVMGRFFALDRDHRWKRTADAYKILTGGKPTYQKSIHVLQDSYAKEITDEFVVPTRLTNDCVKEGDSLVFFNFRADRARQLTMAFTNAPVGFQRSQIKKLCVVSMTDYGKDVQSNVAFPPVILKNTLGEVVSRSGKKQFRLAETEKWAHVTFFFNGLSDKQFVGEDRLLIPSPKVRTYDKTPAMSAGKITREALARLSQEYSLIVVNYANPDMLGHTGDYKKTLQANAFVDSCLARLVPAAQKQGWNIIVTADHGNAERMLLPNGSTATSHTTNKVPFILISNDRKALKKLKNPALHHIAPTILKLLGIKKPKEMGDGFL